MPLASTFILSAKEGKETYVQPVVENGGYQFTVKVGKPKNADAVKGRTKAAGRGANFFMPDVRHPDHWRLHQDRRKGRADESPTHGGRG